MPSSPDVVIAGAGIIGLSAALAFAERGLSVTVLEQGQAMCEASWAAAGMLAAHDPGNPPALRSLAELSLALYPQFLASVQRLSGVAVLLRTAGTLQGSDPGDGGSEGKDQGGPSTDALSFAALEQRVPGFNAGCRSFRWLEEHSLDPRDLCVALPLAVRAAGVTLREHVRFHTVAREGAQLRIETSSGVLQARHFVQCCGAWSPGTGTKLQVEPRKGQMLAVNMPAGSPALTCVLRIPELYLVPRGSGELPASPAGGRRIIVGATVERAGFDRSITEAATTWLLAAAAELWPPIAQGTVTDCWTGLRPATPDLLPILGAVIPDGSGRCASADPAAARDCRLAEAAKGRSAPDPGMWVATGHFRNGILLAPATAHLLAQLVLGEEPTVDLRPFRPERFAQPHRYRDNISPAAL